jgi:hypothetical protein
MKAVSAAKMKQNGNEISYYYLTKASLFNKVVGFQKPPSGPP